MQSEQLFALTCKRRVRYSLLKKYTKYRVPVDLLKGFSGLEVFEELICRLVSHLLAVFVAVHAL